MTHTNEERERESREEKIINLFFFHRLKNLTFASSLYHSTTLKVYFNNNLKLKLLLLLLFNFKSILFAFKITFSIISPQTFITMTMDEQQMRKSSLVRQPNMVESGVS